MIGIVRFNGSATTPFGSLELVNKWRKGVGHYRSPRLFIRRRRGI